MTTREKYLAKPRTDFKTIAYNIARMLGLKCNMIHPKAVREYSTSRQLTYHEVILLVAAALAITAITTLASCSADDTAATAITPNQPIHEPIEVNIGSNLTVTRSTTSISNNSWTDNDQVTVIMDNQPYAYSAEWYDSNGDASNDKVRLTRSDVSKHYWSKAGQNKTIYAWSFGNGTAPTFDDASPSGTTVPTNFELTTDGTADLLYATNSATHPAAFDLDFYHQLAKITVKVKAEVSEGITVNSVTLLNMPNNGTFSSLYTGSGDVKCSDPTGSINITAESQDPSGDGVIAQYTAVIIPATYASGKEMVQINTNKGSYTWKLAQDENFYAGKNFNINITLKNQLKIGQVTLETASWATVNTTDALTVY